MSSQASKSESTRIGVVAAEWLVKRDRGLSAAEQDEYLQWLSADPRHGEWLARHQETWREFDQLAQWRPEHSAEPNPDLLARPRARVWWVVPATALAAAAGIALALGLRWSWFQPAERAAAAPQTIALAVGYERRVLADGSVVELNRGASIEVRLTDADRRVALLSGEAHFTVAKNIERPFIVRAHGVDVRAVGTAFNVRLDRASIQVLVTEGRVAVESPAARRFHPDHVPPVIVAGQRAVVPLAATSAPVIAEVSATEIAQALAWQPQLLDFPSTPLAQVLAEFNRRNRVQLVLADEELATLPIVASIRSDNIEGFVRLLAGIADVQAEPLGANEILLRRRP